MNGKTRDERLRRLLRQADPGDGETGLTGEERREMRRTVLTADPEPRRRYFPSPALAGAAVAALAAIVVFALWPDREQPAAKPSRQPTRLVSTELKRPPAPSRPPAIEPSPAISRPAVQRRVSRVAGEKRAVRRHRRSAQPAAETTTAMMAEVEPRTRQIQFSTPGGTRVLWILTSDKAL